MNAAEFDALLRQFLVDHQLNPAERLVLQRFVSASIRTDHQRNVARSRVFAAARAATAEARSVLVIDFIEDVLKVLLPMEPAEQSLTADEVFFSPGDACLNRIVSRFNSARRSVEICIFTITDNRITQAILDCHARGVKLRIITDNEKAYDEGSDIMQLRAAGIPLLVDGTPQLMHHKFAIFDGLRVLNGSYNWTRTAASQNAENLVDSGDPVLIARFQNEFDAIWKKLG